MLIFALKHLGQNRRLDTNPMQIAGKAAVKVVVSLHYLFIPKNCYQAMCAKVQVWSKMFICCLTAHKHYLPKHARGYCLTAAKLMLPIQDT